MVDYTPIYSRTEFLIKRINPAPDQTAKAHLEKIQEDVDEDIQRALRAKLGSFDKNNFEIKLPLTGEVNIIDEQSNSVTLKMEKALQRVADDLVISEYRRDASESTERREIAKDELIKCLDTLYGITISSVRPDFTTEYLTADAITSENGEILISQNEEIITFQGADNQTRIP